MMEIIVGNFDFDSACLPVVLMTGKNIEIYKLIAKLTYSKNTITFCREKLYHNRRMKCCPFLLINSYSIISPMYVLFSLDG